MFLSAIFSLLSKIFLFTGKLCRKNSFDKPLTLEEEQECFKKLENGDKYQEEILCRHNMRLVAHISKKYKGKVEQEELISVGSIGLLKAVKSYRINKGNSFSTYATRCIENEILMYFRAEKKYNQEISLSDAIGSDKEGNEIYLMDILADSSDLYSFAEQSFIKSTIEKIINNNLEGREKDIIILRYGLLGNFIHTQNEVAKILNISRSYVSRIEKEVLIKLKKLLKNRV